MPLLLTLSVLFVIVVVIYVLLDFLRKDKERK
jgi:hypothetical protein